MIGSVGRDCAVEGVRGDEAAVAGAGFFTVTVFVLIFGLFGFINMAGNGASANVVCESMRRGGRQQITRSV